MLWIPTIFLLCLVYKNPIKKEITSHRPNKESMLGIGLNYYVEEDLTWQSVAIFVFPHDIWRDKYSYSIYNQRLSPLLILSQDASLIKIYILILCLWENNASRKLEMSTGKSIEICQYWFLIFLILLLYCRMWEWVCTIKIPKEFIYVWYMTISFYRHWVMPQFSSNNSHCRDNPSKKY